MAVCAVKKCKNSNRGASKASGVKFHRFPKSNSILLKKMISICGREEDWEPGTNRMCSFHYLPLKNEAENVLFGSTEETKEDSQEPSIENKEFESSSQEINEEEHSQLNASQEVDIEVEDADSDQVHPPTKIHTYLQEIKQEEPLEINEPESFLEIEDKNKEEERVSKVNHVQIPNLNFKCEKCGKLFINKEALRKHLAVMHPLQCEHCNEAFSSRKMLDKHCMDLYGTAEETKEDSQKASIENKEFESSSQEINEEEHSEFNDLQEVDIEVEDADSDQVHPPTKINPYLQEIKQEEPLEINEPELFLEIGDKNKEEERVSKVNHVLNFKCVKCGKPFLNKEALRKHLAVMHPLKCEHCNEAFSSRKMLDKHCSLEHSTETQKCPSCGKILENQTMLNNHLVTAHKFFKCEICSKFYASKNSLRNHTFASHMHNIRCEHCNGVFATRKLLNQHCSEKHSKLGRNCHLCNAVLGNQSLLEIHFSTEHNLNQCDICAKLCASKEALGRHLANMHPLTCVYCNACFTSRNKLNEHCSTKHAVEIKCLVCGEVLDSHIMDKHLATFHKDLQCGMCAKVFVNKSDLRLHMSKRHPFKCGFCDKRFISEALLNQHSSRAHESEERKCHLCGEVLENQASLDIHMAARHKFIKCEICSKFYSDEESFQKHNRIYHPWKCESCGVAFTSEGLLNKHISEEHVKEYKKCHLCTATCSDQEMLDTHLVSIHSLVQCKVCARFYATKKSLRSHMSLKHPKHLVEDQSGEVYQSQVSLEDEQFTEKHKLDDDHTNASLPKKPHFEGSEEDSIEIGRFECDQCEEYFESFHELEYHKKIHIPIFDALNGSNTQWSELSIEGEEIFQCSICDKVFEFSDELEQHSKIHIKEELIFS